MRLVAKRAIATASPSDLDVISTRPLLAAYLRPSRMEPRDERGTDPRGEREPVQTVWLLIEWRDGEADPANYYFSSLPEDASLDSLVAITTQRWRTERAYQDLKGELGLDHYEGRKFRGWHHHISVVLCCYAFAVAERHRIFPLQSRRPRRDGPLRGTA